MRRSPAVPAVLLGVALAILSAASGWAWYVEGPWVVLVTVAVGYLAGACLGPWSAAMAVVLLTTAAVMVSQRFEPEAYHWLDDAVFFGVAAGGPAIAGAAVATRARQVRRLERLERELAAQRDLETRAAALEERLRLRSTVHERVAERIAAIALLAEGARRGGAEAVMACLESEARSVLDDLRETIGVLRDRTSRQVAFDPALDPAPTAGAVTVATVTGPAPPRSSPGSAPVATSTSARPGPVDLAVPTCLALAMSVEIALRSQPRAR